MQQRTHYHTISYQECIKYIPSFLSQQRQSVITFLQIMNHEDVASIISSSNYSGFCGDAPLSNGDLLKLMDEYGNVIYGPTLFALKYRVLPCRVNENLHATLGDYDDVYNFDMFGQLLTDDRGQQGCGKGKQGGMYHATRLVS